MSTASPNSASGDPAVQCAGIIPAAGLGLRLGGRQPKALRDLGGLPLYMWGIRTLAAHPLMRCILLATPADHLESVNLQVHDLLGQQLVQSNCTVQVVAGGDTRQDSVRLALGHVPDWITHVLVHDAARPLTPPGVVDAVVRRLEAGAQAVIPAVPVADTIKQVQPEQGAGNPEHPAAEVVVRTLPRQHLRAVQTPQGFTRAVLIEAHERALGAGGRTPTPGSSPLAGTDDATLVENLGVAVSVVAGAVEAFKITTSMDFVVAQMMCANTSAR